MIDLESGQIGSFLIKRNQGGNGSKRHLEPRIQDALRLQNNQNDRRHSPVAHRQQTPSGQNGPEKHHRHQHGPLGCNVRACKQVIQHRTAHARQGRPTADIAAQSQTGDQQQDQPCRGEGKSGGNRHMQAGNRDHMINARRAQNIIAGVINRAALSGHKCCADGPLLPADTACDASGDMVSQIVEPRPEALRKGQIGRSQNRDRAVE